MKQQLFFLLMLCACITVQAQTPQFQVSSVDSFLVYEINKPENYGESIVSITRITKLQFHIINGKDTTQETKITKTLLHEFPIGNLDYFIDYNQAKQNPGKKVYYQSKHGGDYVHQEAYYRHWFFKRETENSKFWVRYHTETDTFDYGAEKLPIQSSTVYFRIIISGILLFATIIIVFSIFDDTAKKDFFNWKLYFKKVAMVLLYAFIANTIFLFFGLFVYVIAGAADIGVSGDEQIMLIILLYLSIALPSLIKVTSKEYYREK